MKNRSPQEKKGTILTIIVICVIVLIFIPEYQINIVVKISIVIIAVILWAVIIKKK